MENPSLNAALNCLTDRRRRVLDILLGYSRPARESELAAELADHQTDSSGTDEQPLKAIRTDLYHVQLPALEAAGLLEWDRDSGFVDTAEHPIYDDSRFRQFVAADADLEALVDALTHERRRRLLAALDANDCSMEESSLTRAVAADLEGSENEVKISLHHVDLPKLEDAGLLDRETDGEGVVRLTPSEIEREWFETLREE